MRGWRVKKKTRRSPARTSGSKKEEKQSPETPDFDVTSGLLEGIDSIFKRNPTYCCCGGSSCAYFCFCLIVTCGVQFLSPSLSVIPCKCDITSKYLPFF